MQSMEHAVEAIERMATLAQQMGAHRVEAVATSAVRDAENAELFIARVKQTTGLTLRVLEGEDEARLSFRSALAHFDLGAGAPVVMDIGGGSLELALAADGVVDLLTSLPVGAIRLTERHLRDVVDGQAEEDAPRRSARRSSRCSPPPTGAARASSGPGERSPTSP